MRRCCVVAVRIRLNRASIRFEEQLIRAVNGSPQRTSRLVNKFANSPAAKQIEKSIAEALRNLHGALMWVFDGGVPINSPVSALNVPGGQPVTLRKPWQPLTEEYVERKVGPSYWHETGDLAAYVAKQIDVLSSHPIRKVEVKAAKVQRGAKTVRARMLVTPVRLPEPLQSLIMYPFLQGAWPSLSGAGLSNPEAKLLANSLLRGFMADTAADFGLRALDSVRS